MHRFRILQRSLLQFPYLGLRMHTLTGECRCGDQKYSARKENQYPRGKRACMLPAVVQRDGKLGSANYTQIKVHHDRALTSPVPPASAIEEGS